MTKGQKLSLALKVLLPNYPEVQQAQLVSCRAHVVGIRAGMWLPLAYCTAVRRPCVCSSGAASEGPGPAVACWAALAEYVALPVLML